MAKKKAKDAEGEAPVGAKPGRGKLLVAGGAAVALLALGGGGWFLFVKPKAQQAAQTGQPAGGQAAKKVAFLDLPEMTVNLSGGSNERTQFLRMKIALELAEQKTVAEITPLLPRVVDSFQVYMRELRPNDLEGSAGLYRLREEMTRRVNVAVFPARVDAVLFKELMVQ
jgi:flagellar FliL protein